MKRIFDKKPVVPVILLFCLFKLSLAIEFIDDTVDVTPQPFGDHYTTENFSIGIKNDSAYEVSIDSNKSNTCRGGDLRSDWNWI